MSETSHYKEPLDNNNIALTENIECMLQLMKSSLESLKNGELLICPIDYHFAILGKVSKSSIDRLEDLQSRFQLDTPLTILTPDIARLKSFVPHIHPRVETLLSIHQKALALLHPEFARDRESMCSGFHVRIVTESNLLEVLGHLGESLISLPLGNAEVYATKADQLCNYVDQVFDGIAEPFLEPAPVYATYGPKGHLIFDCEDQ